MAKNDDFSFKKSDVHEDIDEALKQLRTRDKIQLVEKVKAEPPETGYMKEEIQPGVYAIDLNTLLMAQLSDCPATVIPMLIDHGVRTAVDIKETYKPEKRALAFQYWWILFLIMGLGAAYLFLSMFGII